MSASSLPGVFDDEVAQKLDRWRQEYPDLAVRTPGDCLSLIAAEVKKASRAQGDGVLRRLVNIAAMAKLGYENAQRSDER
jgi:alkylhydroperoxidase/carboxymuconolactone decarboxylase family protein YurZ